MPWTTIFDNIVGRGETSAPVKLDTGNQFVMAVFPDYDQGDVRLFGVLMWTFAESAPLAGIRTQRASKVVWHNSIVARDQAGVTVGLDLQFYAIKNGPPATYVRLLKLV